MNEPRAGTPWERLEHETVFRCPYYTLERDLYRLPSGEARNYHYVHTGGSATVIPERPDGRLVLVRQYRYLMRRPSLEFPRGGMQPGDDPLVVARKELEEEAGLVAGELREIGRFAPYNGVSDETSYVFLARQLTETSSRPEETEELTVEVHGVPSLQALARSGELLDGMTLSALYLYLLRR
jgi:ADP-ribose pyrophosphatase